MDETQPKRRWFRFGLRTLFVVVTLAAVGSWTYWIGWSRWVTYREQVQFVESVEHIKVGMTAFQASKGLKPGSHITVFQSAIEHRPAEVLVGYAWEDCIYCIYYVCVGDSQPTFQGDKPLVKAQAFRLAAMPTNYQWHGNTYQSFFQSIPKSESSSHRVQKYSVAEYVQDFAGFISGDRKTNPGFEYELIYSDPPAAKIPQ
jgi:hypothetical protein